LLKFGIDSKRAICIFIKSYEFPCELILDSFFKVRLYYSWFDWLGGCEDASD
jgi:hypothetical protein